MQIASDPTSAFANNEERNCIAAPLAVSFLTSKSALGHALVEEKGIKLPKIYRAMLPDASGEKPKIDCEGGAGLGVRVPPDPNADVHPDESGNISPGEGMSVAPNIEALDWFRIPKRLKHLYPDAIGSNKQVIWSMGEGPFVDAAVGSSLVLRVTSDTHGQVEPDKKLLLDEFQSALARTQNEWQKDEG